MGKYIALAICAAGMVLASCSAPMIQSGKPQFALSINDPVSKSIGKSGSSLDGGSSASRFLSNSSGQTIRVTITGAGIAKPIVVYAQANQNGGYSATANIPIGNLVTIRVQAFDSKNNLYASATTELNPIGGVTPNLSVTLLPDAKSVVDLTGNQSPTFTITPGKISIYKKTITQKGDFPQSYFFFGVSLSDTQTPVVPFAADDYFSLIDSSGNVIFNTQTLYNMGPSGGPRYYFSLTDQTLAPYAGTFYLILWGNTVHSGSLSTFPIYSDS